MKVIWAAYDQTHMGREGRSTMNSGLFMGSIST